MNFNKRVLKQNVFNKVVEMQTNSFSSSMISNGNDFVPRNTFEWDACRPFAHFDIQTGNSDHRFDHSYRSSQVCPCQHQSLAEVLVCKMN